MLLRQHMRIVILLLIVIVLSNIMSTESSANSPFSTTCVANQQRHPKQIVAGSNTPPPQVMGLDAYTQLDKLSYLELGDRVEGQSTADILGSNKDNSHVPYTLPDGERVLFDQTGPGIVTFMRMQENYGGPWHLLLDNTAPATIQAQDLGQMNATSTSTIIPPYPLSLNTQESQGSSILATSIPFQNQFRWTSSQANGNFYALYRKFPYGTQLPSLNNNTQVDNVVNMLRQAGSDIAPTNISCGQGNINIAGNSITNVTTLTGPAQIRALTFHVPFNEKVRFGNAHLVISWDGEKQPGVDAPVKFLVGDGAGVYQPANRPLVAGWTANANGDDQSYMDYNIYWPMPFASQAHIALVSNTALSNISWQVRYEPFQAPTNWWGTFHATYSSISKPTPGQDMTFLDAKGSGKLVGTVINFNRPDSTLEGDPRIYLDDSSTPQIAVTGTEEWGLGGNYWNGGVQTSLPLGGLPSSINNPPGADIDGAALYRYLIADSVPFNRHLLIHWEHGGADQSTYPYRSTILWYGNPAQTATLSDEIQPAVTSSRQTHHYTAQNEKDYTVTAANEYVVHSSPSTATGTQMTGTASFTMALDQHNVGAYLRRTFDYCQPNQRANIYINNQFAGTWYDAGETTHRDSAGNLRCWRDEDFPLPASLTQRKSSVTVRITFVPTTSPANNNWTAFSYQMYSFVMPGPYN